MYIFVTLSRVVKLIKSVLNFYLIFYSVTVAQIVISRVHRVMAHRKHSASCASLIGSHSMESVSTAVQMDITLIKSERNASYVPLDVPPVAMKNVTHVKSIG